MIENWKKYELPELLFFQEGPGVRKWQFKDSGVKLLNVGNINGQRLNLSTTSIYISEEEAYGKYSHFLVDEGDLLIACSGIVVDNFHNKITFASAKDLPLCMNTSTMRFKTLDKNKLNIHFFKYFLQTHHFTHQLRKLITGSAQLNFGSSHIEKISLRLPPLPVQKRITEILDAADALRQKDQALLKKYDELTQSLFLDMFGDPVTNPKGWVKEEARNHIDLLTGYAFKSKDYSDDPNHINLCGGLIIMPWGIEWEKCNKWNPNDTQHLENYWLQKGDIVMAMDRPWISSGFKISKISERDLPSLLVQRTARIRSKESMNSEFIYHLFKSKAFELQTRPTETTVPHISPNDIRNFLVIVPPVELQMKFFERVKSIETQRQIMKRNFDKSEDLFQSLLQKAFKGELVDKNKATTKAIMI